jgi:hypothetical protein
LHNLGTATGPEHLAAAPLLAPLGDYGGLTPTMPPLPGSTAIDAGTVTSFTTDQRGLARPNGPSTDLGAVEAYGFDSLDLADSDSDGIPDILEGPETPYPHLIVGEDNSAADTDGDGSTDAEEIFNMTDLNNPNDNFRILAFAPAAGFDPDTNPVFEITLKTFPSLSYGLEADPAWTGFQTIDKSAFTATNFTHTLEVLLAPGQDFVRGKRN